MILRKATLSDAPKIWQILQDAIEQRRRDGSDQWQNGYPNAQSIQDDIADGIAHVLVEKNQILAYAAILFGIEPAYNDIKGKWLTEGDYVVLHRVATSEEAKGRGVATQLFRMIENMAIQQNVFSIKVDTNFDNIPMLKIFDRLGYTYCGEVFLSGAPRRAYEKVLSKKPKID